MKIKFLQNAYIAGILLVTGSSVAWFFKEEYVKYFFAAGTLMVIIYHFVTMMITREENFVKQRLLRIGLISSLFLALGTYSMFDHSDLWVPSILIYALVTLYRSFRS